jgi:hypothetical protein
MDDAGASGRAISEAVEFGPNTVSRILIENGRRKKRRGVRKVGKEKRGSSHRRVCIGCGKVEMIRSDHKHTKYCAPCAKAATTIKLGNVPPNKGSTERQVKLDCETCGKEFIGYAGMIERRPIDGIRWETYCSQPCWGIANRSPGSKYSEVGKDYPSRRNKRRRQCAVARST